MKLFKRLLALLFVLALLVSCGTTTPSETDPVETGTPSETATEPEPGADAGNELRVVVGANLTGHFLSGFTNSSYDKMVRDLIYDYGTYATDEGGQFVLNKTVVKEEVVTENEDGSKTYTFTINDGLKYNTGEPITAKDYVFDALFAASPEWLRAGATMASTSYQYLVGQKAYYSGADSFPGIKLVDDMTFEMTIDAAQLPYFYEALMISASPSPMFRFAPGVDIGEDGSSLVVADGRELSEEEVAAFVESSEGRITDLEAQIQAIKDTIDAENAKIQEAKDKAEEEGEEYDGPDVYDDSSDQNNIAALEAEIATIEEEIAKAEAGEIVDAAKILLQTGAYDVAATYLFKPDVTTGPYQFLLFENQNAVVELNPNYSGNFQGKTPTVARVSVRGVNQNVDVDMVINGEADLAPGVIEIEKIEKAMAAETEGKTTMYSYPRNGYGVLDFTVDAEPVNHKEVRQAVAFLMDRTKLVEGVSGGYGVVGQGHYGLSQWTYQLKGEEFLDQIEERGTAYALDIDRANELLDASPYAYEEDGVTPWDATKAATLVESDGEDFAYWRHNADGEALVIHHGGASEEVLNVVVGEMVPNGRLAGLNWIGQLIDFDVLLDDFYYGFQKAPENRTYQAFTLGSGFTPAYDPYNYGFHSDLLGTTTNTNQLNDPDADRITAALRATDPTDTDGFLAGWLEWQLWFNDFLPGLPLYSNEYFDIASSAVKGMDTTPDWPWQYDIADIRIER